MAHSKQGATKSTVARETKVYRRSLKSNKRVAPADAPLTPGTTHVERKGDKGEVRLERKRFSII